MEDLKILVEKLEQEHDEKEQVKTLQKIEEKLLNEYVIKIGNDTIEPLLVEAYYYDENKFRDKAVHAANGGSGKIAKQARKRQKNNFGKLYIHDVKNKTDGLDICLSDKEYYLSFLIKNALINGKEFATQSKVSQIICDKCAQCAEAPDCIYNNVIVLEKKKASKNEKIIFLPRKGLTEGYVDAELTAVSVNTVCDAQLGYKLTLANGYGKQWRCSVMALAHPADAREIADKLNGSKIETQYFEAAKKSLGLKE